MMRTSLPALLLLGLSPWAVANAACTPEDLAGATPVKLPAGTVISTPKEFSMLLTTRQDGSFDAIRPLLSSRNRELDRAAAESIRQASLPVSCLQEPGEEILVVFSALPAQPGQPGNGTVQIVRIDPAAPKSTKS
ncbi:MULTISPECIES: hypothetical protein [Stenotrophomonas]|uniref:hypothetical protein n=1 Tax=Stenotrophomonas TaxID=40323 RepID=UPI000D0E27D8|nr:MULTISPECIES: hypothetical protein [Stenotrophomonas]MCU1064932.1 hypothetical protein [Stenotrophomonas maltophilia]PSM14624.1 hypothetical protein CV100_05675 [Stenotrophomonas maltophilia]